MMCATERPMTRRFRRLSIATTVATLLLIAWGGVVRVTGSGDGCPDWPTCFGRWIPRWEYHTLIEYVHRLLGMVSGTLALVLATVAIVALVRARRGGAPAAPRPALWLAVSLAPSFLVQGILGGWVVNSGLLPGVVTIHFAAAFVVLALTVAITVLVTADPVPRHGRGLASATTWTAAATYLLLLVGTYVRARGTGLAFTDWPLMDGRLLPDLSLPGALEMFAHRLLAISVMALLLWVVVRARTMPVRPPLITRLSLLSLAFLVGQVALGGVSVLTGLAALPMAAHVAMSALVWAAVVALAVAARHAPAHPSPAEGTDDAPTPASTSLSQTIGAYVALTKPRIIVLLLITTVPAMLMAARGVPSPWLILATLVGGTLAAGSANAINMFLDRDIDEVMARTRRRPLPGHLVEPLAALRFGYVLGAVAYVFLAVTVNMLAAVVALAAIAYYVFVYTMWLKRTTAQNIVIGGAAGAAPVLVGWAAVTGGLAWPAWALFGVVFAWTPPHFWALALRVREDYAAAGIPMLPVVKGDDETRRQIFAYSLALFGTTLLLVPAVGMGPIYLVTSMGLGGTFTYRALVLWRAPSDDRAWRLFRFSLVYLAALFAAVALDALV
jgi:protoheme IX farnesyltransferase